MNLDLKKMELPAGVHTILAIGDEVCRNRRKDSNAYRMVQQTQTETQPIQYRFKSKQKVTLVQFRRLVLAMSKWKVRKSSQQYNRTITFIT